MELTLEQQQYRQKLFVELLRDNTAYVIQQINNSITIGDLQLPLVRRATAGLCCISKDGHRCPAGWQVQELGTRGKVGVPYIVRRGGRRVLVKTSEYKGSIVTMGRSISGDNVLELDEFTNETIIAYILNYVFDRQRLTPLVIRHLDAVQCQVISTGYNVMELANGGNLQGLDIVLRHLRHDSDGNGEGKVVGIFHQVLTQILVCLRFVQQKCQFTSGDLKAENVVIDHTPIDSVYDLGDRQVRIESNFRCLLVDFGKCSATMTNTQTGQPFRIHSSNNIFNAFKRVTGEIPNDPDAVYYRLQGAMTGHLAQARHGSYRYYPSFDWYTLMLSLLTLPTFRDIMFGLDTNNSLKQIWWYPLWTSVEQADRMENKIMSFYPSRLRTIMQPLSMLQDETLKASLDDMVDAAFPIRQRESEREVTACEITPS